jgi:hypothetical protein
MSSRALTTATGDLHRQEERIERGLAKLGQIRRAFLAVGHALRRIRGKRLYRATHRSWEKYLRARWGMGRSDADKIIAAAATVESLGPAAARLSARAARKLIPFQDRPEVQRAIVERARQSAARGEPTAEAVARAAREVLEELPAADRAKYRGQLVPRAPAGEDGRPGSIGAVLLQAERLRVLIQGLGPRAPVAIDRLDALIVAIHQID